MKINMINNPKLLILKHMFDIKGISEENLENLTKNQYEIYRDCIESYRFGVAFIDYLQCLREEKCNWGLMKDMLEFCQTREAMTRFIDFCAQLRSKKKIYQKIYNTFGSECEELATIVLRWSMHDGFDDAEKLKNSLDNIIDFLIAVMPQLGIKNVRKLTLPKLMPFWSKEYLILGVKAFNIGKEVIKTVEDLGLLLEEMQKYISASYINIDDNTHLNHEDKKYYRICSTFHPFKNIEHELMKNLIIQSKVAHVDIILEKIAQHGEVCGRYRMELSMYAKEDSELWQKIKMEQTYFDSAISQFQQEKGIINNDDKIQHFNIDDNIAEVMLHLILQRQLKEKNLESLLESEIIYTGSKTRVEKFYEDTVMLDSDIVYNTYNKNGKESKDQTENYSKIIDIIDGALEKIPQNLDKLQKDKKTKKIGIFNHNGEDKKNHKLTNSKNKNLIYRGNDDGNMIYCSGLKNEDHRIAMTEIKPIKIHILADKKEKIFLTKRIYNRKKLEENSDIQIEYINPKNEFDLLRKKRAQYDIRKNLHLRLRSETLDIDTKYLNLQKSPFSKKIYLKTPLLKVKAEMQHPKAFGGNIIDFTFKNQLIELLSIHGITQKNAQNLFESQVLWQYYTKHKKCRTSIIKYLQILNKEKCMIWNKIEMLTREKLVDFLEDAMILRSRCELYKRIGGKKCDELGWALHASGGNAGSFNMIALRFIEILKSHMPSFEHEDLSKIRMHSTMFKYSSYFSYLDEVAKEKKENSSDMSTTMGIAKFNKLLFKTHLMLEYRLVKSGIKQTAHINGYEYGVYYESCGHIPCSIAIKMLKQGFENTMTAEWINDMVIFGGIVAKGNEKENGIDDALLYVNNKTPENEINKNNNKVAVLLKKESLIWDMQL